MARHVLKEGPDAKISIHSRVNRHNHMSNDIIVSRKDVREALGTLRRNGSPEYQRIGWTKRYLCVRPADGLVVRNPENMELLPPDGASVPDDLDWRRMIRDGDVLLIEKRATID